MPLHFSLRSLLRRALSRLPAAALLATLGPAAALAAALVATPALPAPRLSAPPPPVRPPASASAAPHDLPWDAGLTVDTQDRAAVAAFYRDLYLPDVDADPGWTGSVEGCAPGETSAAFKEAVIRRVNFYRALAGAPAAVTLDETKNRRAQAAALMMAAAGSLNHTPPEDWPCYSADGRAGAGSSNLAPVSGPDAIDLYMQDPGDGNTAVGHRTWVLRPTARLLGTGDVPAGDGHGAANALSVFDDYLWDPFSYAEGTRDGFLAWPPAGFSPQELAGERWHFQYGGEPGDEIEERFAGATVRVRHGESTIAPEINHRGGDYIVWTMPKELLPLWGDEDVAFEVTVAHVLAAGGPRSFTYEVTLFLAGPPPAAVLRYEPQPVPENGAAGLAAGRLVVRGTDPQPPYFFWIDDAAREHFDLSSEGVLTTRGPLDAEAPDGYAVWAAALGRDDVWLQLDLIVPVQDVDEPPTGVELESLTLPAAAPPGAHIGLLSARDPDRDERHTFSLPAGRADNALFAVQGAELLTAQPLPAERSTFTVVVAVTDRAGLSAESALRLATAGSVPEGGLWLPLVRP